MALRCYVESLTALPREAGGIARIIELPEQEAHHATGSRRLSVGDALIAFDGRGNEAAGEIVSVSRRTVQVRVGDIITRPRPRPALTLAVALPKGPRQDELIEKCTELGTAVVQPLLTERSVSQASDHKREKWQRTGIEAVKQSGQCWLPEFAVPAKLDQVLSRRGEHDLMLAALLPKDGKPVPVTACLERLAAAKSVLALVGPEGGWSPAEAEALMGAGAIPVSLGPNVLRIETAAIAMAAMVHACAGASSLSPVSRQGS